MFSDIKDSELIRMKIKHIIWDWNGTLVNDLRLSVDIFNTMTDEYGKSRISVAQYLADFRFPVIDFYTQHGFDFSKEDFGQISDFYINAYNSRRFECDLHEDAAATVRALKDLGCTHSVLSAYKTPFLTESIMHYGIEDCFESIAGLDDNFGNSKVELGKRHVAQIKAAKDEILMVGDTEHDKHTADAMGVRSVLLSAGHNHRDRLKKLGVPVLDSHKEIFDFLTKGL